MGAIAPRRYERNLIPWFPLGILHGLGCGTEVFALEIGETLHV